jgi:hypothetical protein
MAGFIVAEREGSVLRLPIAESAFSAFDALRHKVSRTHD